MSYLKTPQIYNYLTRIILQISELISCQKVISGGKILLIELGLKTEMFDTLAEWFSPPPSPNRNDQSTPSEQNTPPSPTGNESHPPEQHTPPGQNWVKLSDGLTYTQFESIVSISCYDLGQVTFQLEWLQNDLVNMLASPAVDAGDLVHNNEANRWVDRFTIFRNMFGSDTPITGPYTWQEMETSGTLDSELVDWLAACGLSAFGATLANKWHVSISMVRHLDKETLESWGMKETPCLLMMDNIRNLK
jgi:hypothetical protein